jgi:hypothetical protein
MTHLKVPVVLLILAFFIPVGIACKRKTTLDSSVGTVKPVSEEKDENGWPLYSVPEEGFALALPSHWRQIDMNPKTFESGFQKTIQQNPQLNDMLGNLRNQVVKGIKFFGFDETTMRSGFATNVNVLHLRLPGQTTLDEAITNNLMELDSLSIVKKPFAHDRVKLVAGDAERFHYKMEMESANEPSRTLDSTQFLYVTGNECYYITMVTSPDKYEKYKSDFNIIGQSFRLIKDQEVKSSEPPAPNRPITSR